MKKFTLALLALGAIGFVAVPARADEAYIQDARQTSIIDGYNNTSIQEATQVNKTHHNRRGRRSTGVVQTSDQYGEVYGEGNYNRQRVRQGNANYSGKRGRRFRD